MTTSHIWKFIRAGGFDQVALDSGADLLALHELDQKLWAALSCPTRGIEFDEKTLTLIDADGDGQVRANEVLAAIAWAGGLLRDADLMVKGADALVLDDMDDSREEGRQLLASARHILKSLGKPDAKEVTLADMADIEKFVAGLRFNGDGIVCPDQSGEPALRAALEDIIKCMGSLTDLSGKPGIDQDMADRFFAEAAAYCAWQDKGGKDTRPLGEQTEAGAAVLRAVKDKVGDYFTRCQLAAYDARAAVPLSRAVEDYQRLAAQSLSAQNVDVADFPLAMVAADRALPLISGINPAWQDRVNALNEQVVVPLLGEKGCLTASEWEALCTRFSAFDAWLAEKPATSVESLGIARLREMLGSRQQEAINGLIAQDKAVEAEVKAICSVEKLLRYQRDLYKLVNNFVSFRDFYSGKKKATFQVGTLYLDGRSCELCVRVDDVAKHASFASSSGVCLVYCECVRGAEKMNIAAAFTSGDSDFLSVGRNGVFYDRKGRDWNASIVRIIEHPISVRQAFWSPYKKLSRLVSEQLQKFAASKAGAVDDKMGKAVAGSGQPLAEAPAAVAKPPFDVAKFAGIFAAIGLAIGAIGGILASIVGGVLGLKFWQIPLALVGLMLLVSGPSMVLAWFKLKRRNLAPILDACGWAINSRAYLNIPFGTSLTGLAALPQGASRTLTDPFEEKPVLWPYYLLIATGIVALLGLWYVGFFG